MRLSRLSRIAILCSLGLAVAFLAVQPASADTIDVFSLSGATFADGTSASGTVTVDITTGLITAANVLYGGKLYDDILFQGAFFGNTNSGKTPVPVDYEVDLGITSSSLPRIDFGIFGTSLVDSLVAYAGGNFASDNNLAGPDQQGNEWVSSFHSATGANPDLKSGKLVFQSKTVTSTPEPSTVLLLVVALFGLSLSLHKQPRRSQLMA